MPPVGDEFAVAGFGRINGEGGGERKCRTGDE